MMEKHLLNKLTEASKKIIQLHSKEYGKDRETVRFQDWEIAYKNLELIINEIEQYTKTQTNELSD